MKIFNLLILGSILFAACSSNKSATSPETKPAEVAENKALEGTYWVLTELNGQPVPAPKEGEKPSYIYFDAGKHRVSVSGGCNTMGGSYELKEGNRIGIGNLISTMMACPDMTNENGLKKMAETVDTYAIQGDNLMFAKARMAPFARFKASAPPSNLKVN